VADWNAARLERIVRNYVAENQLKLGEAAQPLRAALTGKATSPGIFDVLEVLGQEESIARLQDQAG
jgi:glutamyl-tRNA synthetase